jgi:hypothetical protein
MVMRVFVAGGTGVVRRPPASLVKLVHKMAPPGIYDATCHAGEVTGFPSAAAAPSVG